MTMMGFNYNDALSAFLILFAVIDIPGSIPIIVGLRKKVGHVQSEKATAVAGIIMIVLYVWGDIREAIDKTNTADNTVEEENYNANEYSKETAEEMR